jgi:hypothetical protein
VRAVLTISGAFLTGELLSVFNYVVGHEFVLGRGLVSRGLGSTRSPCMRELRAQDGDCVLRQGFHGIPRGI